MSFIVCVVLLFFLSWAANWYFYCDLICRLSIFQGFIACFCLYSFFLIKPFISAKLETCSFLKSFCMRCWEKYIVKSLFLILSDQKHTSLNIVIYWVQALAAVECNACGYNLLFECCFFISTFRWADFPKLEQR